MTDEEAVERGFIRLKSLLMEAQEEFGRERGQRLVALAMQWSKEHGGTTVDAYYALAGEFRQMLVDLGDVDG
jgi:hypothetical protein